jgi:hypothetical protein
MNLHYARSLASGFTLALLLLGPSAISQAATSPTRIGVFVARMSLSASGSYSGSVTSVSGSANWSEDYSWTLQSECRTEVTQSSRTAYGDGAILESHSSETVGGGGSAAAGPGTKSWTYQSNPDFDTQASHVASSLIFYLDPNKVSSAWASRTEYRPPRRYRITPEGELPLDGAWSAVAEAVSGLSGVQFEVPSDLTASWSYTKTVSTNVSWTGLFEKADASATCTYSVEYIPEGLPQWEAVMEPNPFGSMLPAFDQWLPVGGEDESKPGGICVVRVFLRSKTDPDAIPPLARFTIQLSDVSREPGICLNFPHRSAPPSGSGDEAPFDLQIAPGKNMKLAENGQYAEVTNAVAELRLGIQTYDYGAFGKLKVTANTVDGQTLVAHVDGHPDQFFLNLPVDENQNHVADAWEKDMEVFDRDLDAKWEGTLDPKYDGQALEGDGISLYEKYRGFQVLTSAGDPEHERLDPKLKYLFVRNPDRLAREIFRSEHGLQESYPAASKCEVRYVGSMGWTGPGAFKDKKRIVNFNYTKDKHAVDQHALYVTVNPSKNPFQSDEWVKLARDFGRDKAAEEVDAYGCTYLDYTAPAAYKDHWRPASTFQVEIYAANLTNRVYHTVRYHTEADCPSPCDEESLQLRTAAHIGAHPSSFSTKYTIAISATTTHEMGHATGMNHHEPAQSDPLKPDLANCIMRYYRRTEFERNVADRFELLARGHNPSLFCRNIFDCWGQLQVTDNPAASKGAAPASPVHHSPSRVARAGLLLPPLFPVETRLELSADLEWPEVVAGDPLRLWVRLHGTTSAVAANWTEGLVLTLRRLSDSNPPEVVLEPDRWPAFLQPVSFDTRLLAITNVTRIREFLVPPDVADLEAGTRYALDVAWKGAAFAPAMLLPTNGVVTIPTIDFEVQAATNATLEALGHRHLAWFHYLVENSPGVLTHTREADRLDPEAAGPLAIQTQLMRATAAASLQVPLEGAQVLDRLRRQPLGENNTAAEVVADRFRLLVPEMRVAEIPDARGGWRLEVRALPGQTYVLQGSTDLITWTSISTHTPGTSQFEWPRVLGTEGRHQFYRVLWGVPK